VSREASAERVNGAVGMAVFLGACAMLFFALSAFHALHVLGGLVAIALLLRPRASADARPRRLRLATLYMDFVAAVWLIIYVAVCVA